MGPHSSVVERQSCKLKVLGSIPSGGSFVRAPSRPTVEWQGLYSSVVERQSCKLKVLGSIPVEAPLSERRPVPPWSGKAFRAQR